MLTKLPKKYQCIKKVKSKLWHEAVIKSCEILLNRYEHDADLQCCPLCSAFMVYDNDIGSTLNECRKCPWVIYNKANYDCMGKDVDYTKTDFKERIKRLKEWRRRSRISLTHMRNNSFK